MVSDQIDESAVEAGERMSSDAFLGELLLRLKSLQSFETGVSICDGKDTFKEFLSAFFN